jgi:hypothetical protein
MTTAVVVEIDDFSCKPVHTTARRLTMRRVIMDAGERAGPGTWKWRGHESSAWRRQ